MVSTFIDRILSVLDLGPWSIASILLPSTPTVTYLAELLVVVSAAFLALLLLSYTFSPLGRLIRAHGPTCRMPVGSHLHTGLVQVAQRCGQKMPSLWVVESNALNARALAAPGGRKAVLLTTGLVQSLTDNELRWVFAHELAHLHYGDAAGTGLWLASQQWSASAHRMRINILNRTIRAAGKMPLIWVVAPFLAVFFRMFVATTTLLERTALAVLTWLNRSASRQAEFRADAYAAAHINCHAGITVLQRLAVGGATPLADLIGTHPSASRRIERLRSQQIQSQETSKNPV